MTKEHQGTLHHESSEKSSSKFNKIFKNYWAVAAIALAILLIVILLASSLSSISKNEAGEKILNYLNENSQGQMNASITNITSKGSVYEVIVSANGQEVPVYVTKDGKNFIPPGYLIPFKQEPINQQNQPIEQSIAQSNKPKVELFVMSYCPFGTQAEKGIIPVVNLLKDKIDFDLKFVDYIMHPSAGEVEENTRQYCIQKEQESKLIPYLTCFLKEGKSDACLTETGVDKTKLDACYKAADKQFNITANLNDKSSWLSGQFPKYNVESTDNEKYGIRGSPSLIVNGVEVPTALNPGETLIINGGEEFAPNRSPDTFLRIICSAFNNAPEECSQTLSGASPSSGFGFDATSSGTTATCG